ncbi:MAG: alpha/beta hydrolase [Myxococcales bacterium]|nr:alpha/beta hydrolase [Myxococcales bacterium]
MTEIHPELARAARWIPHIPSSDFSVKVMQWLTARAPARRVAKTVERRAMSFVSPSGGHTIEVFVHRPRRVSGATPALLWMHGGGYVLGSPAQDAALNASFADKLEITVVAVRYRLAPQHPYPAGLEDCYAALEWMRKNADAIGIDGDRIAVGGASAGGGLAAALALLARDRDGAKPVFQLLVYPMLDDRTTLRTDIDERSFRLWRQQNNRYAWRAYLGRTPGEDGIERCAAPSRCESLHGLAPAWIGVGTADLFHDEDLAYAQRLEASGVSCERTVVDGGYHAFDVVSPDAEVSRAFLAAQLRALGAALRP